jgi:predicted transcriptional regulator
MLECVDSIVVRNKRMGAMAKISLRVSEQEKEQISDYAKLRGASVSAVLRDAFFEKIDWEYSIKRIVEIETSADEGTIVTHDELTEIMRDVQRNI